MSKKPARYEEQEPLSEDQLQQFRELLEGRRKKLLGEAEETMEAVREEGAVRLSDDVDQASAEYDRALERRIRDREKGLLKKIDKALRRMAEGEYDECESCSNCIGHKRLSARPEASLCIECKEEQEQVERKFKDRREEADTMFSFK